MKKYLKITLLVIIAIILVGTFVFLYQKSKPKVSYMKHWQQKSRTLKRLQ